MAEEVTPETVVEGLGAFDELERLGAGTFGTTFRAQRGGDEYALKVLHIPDSPDTNYLWDREIGALRRVDHPNVVGFRRSSSFTVQGREYPYLECEFIEGGTIEDALKAKRGVETADELRGLIAGLLTGLREIHDLGIIHRDIKPANVALREGDWTQPVLLDFGLARVLDMSVHTSYPAIRGTYQYMAPEQLKAEVARTRSDLFAVGAVAYHAGTGQHPFIGTKLMTAQTLHDQIQNGPLRDPSELNPAAWTPKLKEVVLKLLSFEAHERLSVNRGLTILEGDV